MKRTNTRLCGIDESGRGALAGPLVAAAVILTNSLVTIKGRLRSLVKDGKLLNPLQRLRIYRALKKLKTEMHVEVISARSINNHGIGWANREVMRRLIRKIDADKYIIDGKLKLGKIRGKTHRITSIIDADATIPEVILAGIVAKVERDKLMRGLHKQFPKYKWKTNAGYGTENHIRLIRKHGTTYLHRSIFITTALKKIS